MGATQALSRLRSVTGSALAIPKCSGPRCLSNTARVHAGGRALKKVPRIMVHAKRMGPIRMTQKITEPGAVRTKHKSGTPLSDIRDPAIFLPKMSTYFLPVFEPHAVDGSGTKSPPGTAMRFSTTVSELFNVYGKEVRMRQESPYTAELTTVITRDTLALVDRLRHAVHTADASEPLRMCLTGRQWSGKSCLLAQAVAFARDSAWIVIYVPDVLPLVNGEETYEYNAEAGVYYQDAWSTRFAKRILDANKHVLPPALAQQAQRVAGSESSTADLSSFIDALLQQTDVPVLVAIDGAQALFRATDYMDGATLKNLDTYAMSSTRLLLDLATGARSVKRGGAIVAQSYEHPDRQSRALEAALGVKPRAPYEQLNNLTYALLAAKMQRYEVGRMDRPEAAGLFGLMRDTARLLAAPSDRLFLQSYIASDGIAGHIKNHLTHSLSSA